jgi:hypothetical protein
LPATQWFWLLVKLKKSKKSKKSKKGKKQKTKTKKGKKEKNKKRKKRLPYPGIDLTGLGSSQQLHLVYCSIH